MVLAERIVAGVKGARVTEDGWCLAESMMAVAEADDRMRKAPRNSKERADAAIDLFLAQRNLAQDERLMEVR